MKPNLRAVDPAPGAKPLRRRRKLTALEYSRVNSATVRESTGPRYLPSGAYRQWLKMDVNRPKPGLIEYLLYPR